MDPEIKIPQWVTDLESFRRWARSSDFPTSELCSYLDGEIWIIPGGEDFFTHNQVRAEFLASLPAKINRPPNGYFFTTKAVWSHPGANISTQPDMFFVSYDTIRSNRARFIEDKKRGPIELEGSPDSVLEIISDSTEKRDADLLPRLYAKAGVREYWLVDARGNQLRFDIFLLHDGEYGPAPNVDGWITSTVFGKDFKLQQDKDPLGHPRFELLTR